MDRSHTFDIHDTEIHGALSPHFENSRVFSRIERLLIRVPAYAPDGQPSVTALLMTRLGQPMRRLEVTPPLVAGGPSQIDLPLASLASAEYQIEFRVKSAAGEAKDSISFRVTP